MPTAEKTKNSKKASAKQVATSYFEAVGNRDLDAMMEHWEPGGYGYIHGVADLRAPDGYRQWFGALFRAFPDFKMEIVDLVAYGDKAAVRWRATGTFNGTARFEGMEPTGARVDMEGCDLLTIRDGLVQENRAYMNSTEMARQLGAMPPAGSAGEKAMLGAVNLRTRAKDLLQKRSG